MFTNPPQLTVRMALRALFVIALAGTFVLCLLIGSARAATRTFSPAAIGVSTVVFTPIGVAPQSVRSASINIGARHRRLPRATVRHGILSRRLTVVVPNAAKLRGQIVLRIRIGRSAPGSSSPGSEDRSPGSSGGRGAIGGGRAVTGGGKEAPIEAHPAGPTPEAPAASSESPSVEPPAAVEMSHAPEVVIPADAKYVSASGSDANVGTAASPWATIAKAAASASPGDVVVLEPGTYGGIGVTTNLSRSGSPGEPIVFTSEPGGPPAVVRGYVRVTGSYLRLDSLVFDGPTGGIVPPTAENPGGQEVQVSIMYGTDVELTNSEVRDNAWHAGVFVSNATEISLLSNYIHDNGDAATGANLDHGIYWCSGTGVIADNRIEENVAWGVHLYPTASNVVVTQNLIAGNEKGGVIVARESSGNVIEHNTVTENDGYGIRAYELTGAGNVASENLLWKNGQDTYGSGMAFTGSFVSNPATLSAAALDVYGGS